MFGTLHLYVLWISSLSKSTVKGRLTLDAENAFNPVNAENKQVLCIRRQFSKDTFPYNYKPSAIQVAMIHKIFKSQKSINNNSIVQSGQSNDKINEFVPVVIIRRRTVLS